MKSRYTPDGITAMARQHPLLKREESDLAALAEAEEKRQRKAKIKAARAEVPSKPTSSPGKEFSGAEQRRLLKRAKK